MAEYFISRDIHSQKNQFKKKDFENIERLVYC